MTAAAHQNVKTIGTKDIPVRAMDFNFDDDIPTFWFADDPVRSMLLTALSATFPEGERMFMRSVRHYQNNLKDPELKKRVRAFIGQEAHHGKEHKSFNDLFIRQGLPVNEIEDKIKAVLAFEERVFSPKRMLAKTCALEHFTALFAETLLAHPELIEQVDDRLKPLWLWHAIEESEHKSVAYDVYMEQEGDYWTRTSEMAIITVLFTLNSALFTTKLIRSAKNTPRKKLSLAQRAKGLWQHRAVLAELGEHYIQYYKPNFHPSQKDSKKLRDRGIQMLADYVGEKATFSI